MRKWALLIAVLLLVMGLARDAAKTKKGEPDQAYDPGRKWSVEELKEYLSVPGSIAIPGKWRWTGSSMMRLGL